MRHRNIGLTKVPARFVILGAVILLGVLSMAYGYYQNDLSVLYVGLGITVLSAFNEAVLLTVHPAIQRRKRA